MRVIGICVFLSGLLFLLALVSMAAMTSQMIQSRKQELTVHLLYGAGSWLFQIRFFVPFAGILLLLYGMVTVELRTVRESCLDRLMVESLTD